MQPLAHKMSLRAEALSGAKGQRSNLLRFTCQPLWRLLRRSAPRNDNRRIEGQKLIVLLLAFVVLILSTTCASPKQVTPTPEPEERKAALVDLIALTNPNPEFTEQVLAYLGEAGFSTDVYEGEEVTVEFYRTLPTKGYKLILIRTHSTNVLNETIPGGPVFLFTSEIYEKNRYVKEQLTNRIGRARLLYGDDSSLYFAIVSGFIRQDMTGRFDNTLIIIGGCQSLGTPDLAQAFIDRGAAAIVGWNEWVDLSHNDQALLYLLRGLTTEKLTLEQAVRKTMNEIGPDPTYDSILTYLSEKGGTFTLWSD